jgi:hypothetical protein
MFVQFERIVWKEMSPDCDWERIGIKAPGTILEALPH